MEGYAFPARLVQNTLRPRADSHPDPGTWWGVESRYIGNETCRGRPRGEARVLLDTPETPNYEGSG